MAWRKNTSYEWAMFAMGLGAGVVAGAVAVVQMAPISTTAWPVVLVSLVGFIGMLYGLVQAARAPKGAT